MPCQCRCHAGFGQFERLFSVKRPCKIYPGDNARGRTFDISLNTRHLTCEVYVIAVDKSEVLIKQTGRIKECIPVHNAVSYKFRILKPRYHREYSFLLSEFKIRLESHKVIKRTLVVFFSQLYHRIRPSVCSGVDKSHRLHTAVADAFYSTLRKHLYRHTALIHLQVFKTLQLYALCVYKLVVKGLIFFLCHRAVDIIRLALVITCSEKRKAHINAFCGNYRSRRIVEAERISAAFLYLFCEYIACQRTCRNYGIAFRKLRYLAVYDLNIRVISYHFGHCVGKLRAVYRKSAACADLCFLCGFHRHRVHITHFFLKHTAGAGSIRTFQRITAHKLRKALVLMGRRILFRLHLAQPYMKASVCKCPRRLNSGKTCAYNGNSLFFQVYPILISFRSSYPHRQDAHIHSRPLRSIPDPACRPS